MKTPIVFGDAALIVPSVIGSKVAVQGYTCAYACMNPYNLNLTSHCPWEFEAKIVICEVFSRNQTELGKAQN